MKLEKFQPNKILSYFRIEWKVLLLVTISGLIYNLGLLAGPWFEGQMTECLVRILNGINHYPDMLKLVIGYVLIIWDRSDLTIHQTILCKTFCQ